MRPFLVVLLCLLPVCGVAKAQDFHTDLTQRITSLVAPLTENRDLSGVIAWRHGDGPLHEMRFGYADWEAGTPFTAQTPVPAGDITHSITWVLLQDLLRRGDISPVDTLRRYAPDADLSGLNAVADLLARLDQPGTANRSDWALAARIIEQASAARFETLAASSILAPLELNRSSLQRGHGRPAGTAIAYAPGPRPLDLRRLPREHLSPGANGLVSTADDLTRLGQAILQRRIDLFRPDGQMAAGWQVIQRNGQVAYGISGTSNGLRSGILVLGTSELTLAYAINIESYPAAEIGRLVLDLAFGASPTLPVRPETVVLADTHLSAIGQYDSAILGTVRLEAAEGGLDLVLPSSGRRDYLTPSGPDTLFWRRIGAGLTLERDAAGRVTGLSGQRLAATGGPALRLERTDLPHLTATGDVGGAGRD